MKPIVLFDTSVGSENLGDEIIMKYCLKELREIFPNEFLCHIPTHDYMGKKFKILYRNSDLKIVCGTNLLSSSMKKKETMQWPLDLKDMLYLRDVVLMGVGWQQYSDTIDYYSRKLFNNILTKNKLLSVRDSYTEEKLKSMGFENVINTGCPTMWGLTSDLCKQIPKSKSNKVVTTITNYRKDEENDRYLLETLKRKYEEVYIWIQSYYDMEYIKTLVDISGYIIIPPVLSEYERVLNENVDYVGTRLHAGIDALNHLKRTIIIEVDNRAAEIRKDTNIITICRNDLHKELEELIDKELVFNIRISIDNINLWKKQFN